jgi:hypothetical protein
LLLAVSEAKITARGEDMKNILKKYLLIIIFYDNTFFLVDVIHREDDDDDVATVRNL